MSLCMTNLGFIRGKKFRLDLSLAKWRYFFRLFFFLFFTQGLFSAFDFSIRVISVKSFHMGI